MCPVSMNSQEKMATSWNEREVRARDMDQDASVKGHRNGAKGGSAGRKHREVLMLCSHDGKS
jgi:hypothetical protein